MTGSRTRTRLDRVRASVGIAQLALQQIADDLSADDVDGLELAAILRELQEDVDVPGGLVPALAQLVSAAAWRAEQIEPDWDGGASRSLHEAAALLTDNAGQRLISPRLSPARRQLMASAKVTNPPRGECTQCWFHAYASREAHAGLGPREDCPQCVDHMKNGHPDHMIVR